VFNTASKGERLTHAQSLAFQLRRSFEIGALEQRLLLVSRAMDPKNLPFKSNIFNVHSVVIHAPIQAVFKTLSTNAALEEVTMLSSFCSGCNAKCVDEVALPSGLPFQEGAYFRSPGVSDRGRKPGRARQQHFELKETMSIPFIGRTKVTTRICATITWLEQPLSTLQGGPIFLVYYSKTKGPFPFAIGIHRLRKMEEVTMVNGEKATRATEYLYGAAQSLLKPLIEEMAIRGHRYGYICALAYLLLRF